MPIYPTYTHNPAAGDGWFETEVGEAASDVWGRAVGWEAHYDLFADQYFQSAQMDYTSAQNAYRDGQHIMGDMYMTSSLAWYNQGVEFRGASEAWGEAADAAQNDMYLEGQDYDTEWDFWYAYYIGEGAAAHDAANCAGYQTTVPKP